MFGKGLRFLMIAVAAMLLSGCYDTQYDLGESLDFGEMPLMAGTYTGLALTGDKEIYKVTLEKGRYVARSLSSAGINFQVSAARLPGSSFYVLRSQWWIGERPRSFTDRSYSYSVAEVTAGKITVLSHPLPKGVSKFPPQYKEMLSEGTKGAPNIINAKRDLLALLLAVARGDVPSTKVTFTHSP